ncbi:putative nuclear elongation and deformation protein [Triangularia setosa]|uniref:Nuclear elongation and deformation protein n=1 Tax=Triangularia setosa TaxID=2587417 RepID=A0AAN6WGP4_9PEZI|nr:putative nuclear elongation and deformation protein [Podospora setosa]
MQYVRNLSDSVSTAWNSINPATLSGAIDVIVVEQEDGSLLCSPFHVRFGKFSLLRPYEKKVEFKVNAVKQPYSMKLGEGGEAFFVFETSDTIPKSLQTSPLVSPASSPPLSPQQTGLGEPDALDLNDPKARSASFSRPPLTVLSNQRDGLITPRSASPEFGTAGTSVGDWSPPRPHSDDVLRMTARRAPSEDSDDAENPGYSDRSHSPPPLSASEALQRAMNLSRELAAVNIQTHITETGDLMLDMSNFKNNDEDAIKTEILARKVLSEELDGYYDIGALFGVDERGNLWIYSSEEAKAAAMKKAMESTLRNDNGIVMDAASDPGYQSDSSDVTASPSVPSHRRADSDLGQMSIQTPPSSPGSSTAGDPNRNYAKTLRLTSDQLKALNLKPGENSMSFTVNRATCSAYMYLWKYEVPVVISDIDGTITKSDALGHVLNMIGRDWTHAGVAKLYTDIVANGYNIMYLTSRSVGQADTTRAYLAGIVQDGYKLPRGPTILSPDRTMAALRREIYLRKPHIFKMSTLRDIRSLYGPDRKPFYAGFGNRFTDQISYRTVDVPRTRIFTINSNAEVSLDLLSLNKMKLSYVNMTEVVDHYFPPVSTLIKGGGEEYTDFTYWRDNPLELDEFSASDTEGEDNHDDDDDEEEEDEEEMDEDEEYEDEDEEGGGEGMGDSYISRDSYGEDLGESYDEDRMMRSALEERGQEGDDEEDLEEEFEEAVEDELNRAEEDDNEVEEEQVETLTDQTTEEKKKILEAVEKELEEEEEKEREKVKDKVVVQDTNAEMITGIKNLRVEAEVPEK